jgi:hypothetical protein
VVLAACGKPAWQVTREDVDRVVGGLAQPGPGDIHATRLCAGVQGVPTVSCWPARPPRSRRCSGCQVDPLDEFNACRHVAANDSPPTVPPPTPKRLEECFDFLKGRIATARKDAFAGRDYALFRTLYLAGSEPMRRRAADR